MSKAGDGAVKTAMTVPLVDLKAAHAEVADEVVRGMSEVMARTDFIGGAAVVDFERSYAEFVGVRQVIGVSSGTDALEVPLRALGIKPGDEVIVPANSFIATAEAVLRVGGVPVYVDVTPDGLLDPAGIGAAMTSRTVGIMPVHLYGQMADMKAVEDAATRHGLFIIEDAAQAHGAAQAGRPAGSIGIAAGTSFYPGKNLGAYGDAGAVLTSDENLARQARLMINHGSAVRYVHEIEGFNSRLDTLQAVVLSAKLKRLAEGNERRRNAAARYDQLLADNADVTRPQVVAGNTHVWHLYVVQVPKRAEVLRYLNERGVGAGIHYPVPLHLTPALEGSRFPAGQFQVAEGLASNILTLPLFPQITEAQQQHVVDLVQDAIGEVKS